MGDPWGEGGGVASKIVAYFAAFVVVTFICLLTFVPVLSEMK